MALTVTAATGDDVAELARVAAETFPLACPPSVRPADIRAFIEENLSVHRFATYLDDPDRRVFAARDGGHLVGYTMLVGGVGSDPAVGAVVRLRPAVELSKMYVLAGRHGTGAAAALMRSALEWAADAGSACVWLGVNRDNERAQRFYRRFGFAVAGERMFRLGAGVESDFVMVRPSRPESRSPDAQPDQTGRD
ncbi:MAG TPA: GNAT family N-acetyltransferase [Mycobacterium sp.]|nr:GNAT family N-acetyltransferase [Mycobacterium sp.]HPZ95576.1 GNAT family N-acetyltransferase [Mycobacterium sp.]HQE13982.1 GNAT family N-acetyltransferase [Mycobacterium sp.]